MSIDVGSQDDDTPVIVGGAGLMVKIADLEVPPAVVTVTLAVPEVVIRLDDTGAVSLVALTKIGRSEVPPHFTVAVGVKLVPVIASVNAAPPAVVEAGLRLVMVGTAANAVRIDENARPSARTVLEPKVKLRGPDIPLFLSN